MTNFENECLQKVKGVASKLDSLDYDGLCDYFSDFLDVEYRIDSQCECISAYIYIDLCGPDIWVDTYDEQVKLVWGSTRVSEYISKATVENIDAIFSEYYNSLKGE